MTAPSASANAFMAASYISSAEATSVRSTPAGVGSTVCPLMSVTLAPRAASSPATAYPILPLPRVPTKLTESINS